MDEKTGADEQTADEKTGADESFAQSALPQPEPSGDWPPPPPTAPPLSAGPDAATARVASPEDGPHTADEPHYAFEGGAPGTGLGWPVTDDSPRTSGAPRPSGPSAPAGGAGHAGSADPFWATPEVLSVASAEAAPGGAHRGWLPLVTVAVIAALLGGLLGSWTAIRHDDVRRIDLGAAPSASASRASGTVASVAAHTLPSVVSVQVTAGDGGDTGSGFAISGSYVLTNNHVVAAAVGGRGTIQVELTDGRSLPARIVGRSQDYDLAVLRLSDATLPALSLGNSDDVAVGDTVIAVGSPLGLAGTVTTGIISAENRPVIAGEDETSQSYINALQTDAAINPGNSGGPLVDAEGHVIGVNSAIATLGSGLSGTQAGSIGLGFAIPINQARRIAQAIIDGTPVRYPIIGVSVDQRYSGNGAKVADTGAVSGAPVQKGGPADRAGIKPGDVIIAVDGRRVTDGPELIVAIRAHVPGDRISLRLRREGQGERTVSVTLGSAVERLSD